MCGTSLDLVGGNLALVVESVQHWAMVLQLVLVVLVVLVVLLQPLLLVHWQRCTVTCTGLGWWWRWCTVTCTVCWCAWVVGRWLMAWAH